MSLPDGNLCSVTDEFEARINRFTISGSNCSNFLLFREFISCSLFADIISIPKALSLFGRESAFCLSIKIANRLTMCRKSAIIDIG